jgi:hypothetical protein
MYYKSDMIISLGVPFYLMRLFCGSLVYIFMFYSVGILLHLSFLPPTQKGPKKSPLE